MHHLLNELFRSFAPANNGSILEGCPEGLPKQQRKLSHTAFPDGSKVIHLKPLPQVSELERIDKETAAKIFLEASR